MDISYSTNLHFVLCNLSRSALKQSPGIKTFIKSSFEAIILNVYLFHGPAVPIRSRTKNFHKFSWGILRFHEYTKWNAHKWHGNLLKILSLRYPRGKISSYLGVPQSAARRQRFVQRFHELCALSHWRCDHVTSNWKFFELCDSLRSDRTFCRHCVLRRN